MSNKISGTIHLIDDTKTYGSNGFQKRRMVISQSDGNYDNLIPLEFIKDMCVDADKLELGSEITLEFRLSGRKWTRPEDGEDLYFLNAEVTKILSSNEDLGGDDDDDDDVPF